MPPGSAVDATNEGARPRFQFRLRTLLLTTLIVAVAMDCYECYCYLKEVRRYQEYVIHWFTNADNEVRNLLTTSTYSQRGRRLLDEMGASDEYGPWDTHCDAVLTIENGLRGPGAGSTCLREAILTCAVKAPVCVITDASRRVLYWFRLEDVHQHLSSCELFFVRKGQECVLTVDTRLWSGPREGRTIITYTLATNGVEEMHRVDGVPITREWESHFLKNEVPYVGPLAVDHRPFITEERQTRTPRFWGLTAGR